MNQKLMFLVSVVVIVVGVSGIVLNNRESVPTPTAAVMKNDDLNRTEHTTTVKLLVANKALTPGSILQPDDFSVRVIDVSAKSEWIKYGVEKASTEFLGSYINMPIANGEYILPEVLITPNNPEFLRKSLGNYVAYSFAVRPQDQDIVALLSPADHVDIYLLTQSTLSKVIHSAPVLKVNLDKTKKDSQVIVRLTNKQIREIKVLEGEGALIPMASVGSLKRIKSGDIVSDLKKNQIDNIRKLKG